MVMARAWLRSHIPTHPTCTHSVFADGLVAPCKITNFSDLGHKASWPLSLNSYLSLYSYLCFVSQHPKIAEANYIQEVLLSS